MNLDLTPYLKDDGKLNLSKLTKTSDGKAWLASAAIQYGEGRPAQLAYRAHHQITQLPYCKTCNRQLTAENFMNFSDGYRTYCSNKCASSEPTKIAKLVTMLRTDEFKANRRSKIVARFGTDAMCIPNRAKIKAVSMAKYGVDNPLKSKEVQALKTAAVIAKYGVDNVWKLPHVQDRCAATLFARHGVDSPLKLVDWSTIHVTKGHQAILDVIRERYSGEVLVNDRTLIAPLELDIVVPDKKLAIEFNGLYWHSRGKRGDSSYHLRKTEAAAKAGLKLVQVFEDEWADQRAIVTSRILNALGESRRVYARDCEVIEDVNGEIAREFLLEHHSQGYAKGSRRLGLSYRGALVALMTFGAPRFKKSYDWELIRYVSESGLSVVGGASKLLAHFRAKNQGTIITYADRRWSDGGLYRSLGFSQLGATKPSEFLVDPSFKRINRFNAPKDLGAWFGLDEVTDDSLLSVGYSRVWDCGHLIFELK